MKDNESKPDYMKPHYGSPFFGNQKGWPGWKPRKSAAPPSGKGDVKRARSRYKGYSDGGLVLLGIGALFVVGLLQSTMLRSAFVVVVLVVAFSLAVLLIIWKVTSNAANRQRKQALEKLRQEESEGSEGGISPTIKRRMLTSSATGDTVFRNLMIRALMVMLAFFFAMFIGCVMGSLTFICLSAIAALFLIAGMVVHTILKAKYEKDA